MSDFSNNDSNKVNEEELSTVFSNPTEHKKTADKVKKKPKILIVLVCVLAVAVLAGGTWGVVKFIPKLKTDDETSSQTSGIELLNIAEKDAKGITVTNEYGSFNYYTKTEKDEEGTETVNWYLKGYSSDVVSSSTLQSKAQGVLELSAQRLITEMSEKDCGLDSPTATTVVNTTYGKKTKLLLGSQSFDETGYYLKIDGSDKIYLVESDIADSFSFTLNSLARLDTTKTFELDDDMLEDYASEDGSLLGFDEFIVTGKNYQEPLVIVYEPERAAGTNSYLVRSASNRIAENNTMSELITVFSNGLTPDGAYALDVKTESLKKFGFDNPDFQVTMRIKKKSLTYKFAKQDDGNYAVWCDGEKLIKMVLAEQIGFVEYKKEDFYSTWVCLNNIADVKKLTINTAEKNYSFGIKQIPNEETGGVDYEVTYNGNKINTEKFQEFYTQLLSTYCSDFKPGNTTGKSEYSFVFEFIDKIGGENRTDFYNHSDTRYSYKTNGVPLGKVNKSDITKLISSLEELVK